MFFLFLIFLLVCLYACFSQTAYYIIQEPTSNLWLIGLWYLKKIECHYSFLALYNTSLLSFTKLDLYESPNFELLRYFFGLIGP